LKKQATTGEEIYLALDCAATRYFKDGNLCSFWRRKTLSRRENVDYSARFVPTNPIISYQDGHVEDDWDGWELLTDSFG